MPLHPCFVSETDGLYLSRNFINFIPFYNMTFNHKNLSDIHSSYSCLFFPFPDYLVLLMQHFHLVKMDILFHFYFR